ncbi:MAG: hypothetical protein EPO40_25095 [Myxococcaceae bacterium]|nr:MAG: hypothetical protein EPO40_25095 [Myxococcaceae bacterium]
MKYFVLSPVLMLAAAAGCGTDSASGDGRVQVFVEPEDSVTNGLTPGTGVENLRDGWTAQYTKFLVTIGNFRAARSTSSERLTEPRVYVVDLRNVPAGGLVAAEFPSAAAGRWDRFGFDMPNASASATRAQGTSQEDYDRMVRGRYSIYIEATLTHPAGRSCRPTMPTDCAPRTSLTVRWGLSAGTSFDDCAPEAGAAGFAVISGGTVQIKPTIHGDHWFFTNITQGAEVTERRAQWIVDADLDRDGETTFDELRRVRASDVFPSPTYNLSGALVPVNTAYDYLDAQAHTLGDFQGDGECPTRRDLM